jgi:serine/threonine-protein kinase
MTNELIGTVIAGKYRLLAKLGEGAMGVVYRAEQLGADGEALRQVALKMVQPAASVDSGFAKRFLREIRVAARLKSPHVVTVHDAGSTEDGKLFFCMELVEGPTLREILDRDGRLWPERARRIATQICDVLSEAHTAPNRSCIVT